MVSENVMEPENMLSGNLKLEAGREKFEINLTIPANPVKPQRILPVLQKFTNQAVERGIQRDGDDHPRSPPKWSSVRRA